jgi:hydroxysqualene dehydroxylase
MMAASAAPGGALRLAVIGAGWAGLSAAVQAQRAGHTVTLFEMSRVPGGRARSVGTPVFDNGQHILIGAYRETLALMQQVGIDIERVLMRQALTLQMAGRPGLSLKPGPAAWAFLMAVLRCADWRWHDKLNLLRHCLLWAARGFRVEPDCTVDQLCAGLPMAVRSLLIDPLCVAALNTPAREASAAIFLRVLHDGLFGGRGACDLLLPRQALHELLPGPATAWLQQQGATVHLGHRVQSLLQTPNGWTVDGATADAVVLACSAVEAARLVRDIAPAWSTSIGALRFEPIVTAYVRCPGVRLGAPMLALPEDADSPAQFVFDHGALTGDTDRYVFVVSGAAAWVEAGLAFTGQAVLAQAERALQPLGWAAERASIEHLCAERRATFRSTPGLTRPTRQVADRLLAAGDYVAGPYPATLEGAVRSGLEAIASLSGRSKH